MSTKSQLLWGVCGTYVIQTNRDWYFCCTTVNRMWWESHGQWSRYAVEADGLRHANLLWCFTQIILNRKCISQNDSYKQHHTMDYLQKPITCSKCLVFASKVNNYVNKYVSDTNILLLCFVMKTVKIQILSHVVNIKWYRCIPYLQISFLRCLFHA